MGSLTIDLSFWASCPRQDQIEAAHNASVEELRAMALGFDWATQPAEVLDAIIAQDRLSLAAAMTVFFNGDPERFNYMPHAHVPETMHPVTGLLDTLCERINAGLYTLRLDGEAVHRARAVRWLQFQQEDRQKSRAPGRWVLLPERVVHLFRGVPEALGVEVAVPVTAQPRPEEPEAARSPFRLFDWRRGAMCGGLNEA
jgi:hypothetical protein